MVPVETGVLPLQTKDHQGFLATTRSKYQACDRGFREKWPADTLISNFQPSEL